MPSSREKNVVAYNHCQLCPRACGVNRASGQRGYCGETAELRVASASIHRGEEPPITGEGGSGTIFISGCNLGCVFCQNYQISQEGMGTTLLIEDFARVCLSLEQAGAENINIVTGSHAIPAIVAGVKQARTDGLTIPILWNSSGYESLEALSLLEDVVSVYLPDLKTLDSALAARFFNAPDYPEYARNAILRMLSYQSQPRYEGATLKAGVIVRHLVLPGYLDATRAVLRWFAEHCQGYRQGYALLSLMTQYTPVERRKDTATTHTAGTKSPQGFVNEREYETILGWLEEFGIEDGFLQELTPDASWLPDFRRHNPFDLTLSVPVWHWKNAVSVSEDFRHIYGTSGDGSKSSGTISEGSGNSSKGSGNGSEDSGTISKSSGNSSKGSGDGSKSSGNSSKGSGDGSKSSGDVSEGSETLSKSEVIDKVCWH